MSSTLKDIAKKLNMSVSTVSRVVNNKSYVNPKTREMVMEALKEFNYTPNLVARSLKNKSTNTIGVIVPDINEVFFAYVIKGIDEILSKNGYTIILCDTGENPEKEERYLNLLLEKQIDAIVLATVCKKHDALEKYFAKGLPVVFIDNLPNVKMKYDSVMIDNSNASYMAVEHLIGLGHKKIGLITGKIEETTGYERLQGYKKALTDNDIEVDEKLIRIGDFKKNSGYENMVSLIDSGSGITAVHVASSKMTFGAVKAVLDKGLSIPDDIALVGFDVHDDSGLITPGISTVVQPEMLIGKLAGELIVKRLNDGNEKFNQKIVLDSDLVIKDSCGYKRIKK